MTLRPLLVPLSAVALLLSTLSCSKKDEPAASATGSYKLDAITVACQPKAYASSSSSGGLSYDYLLVELPATPQLATGAPVVQLYFVKASAVPNTQYGIVDMLFKPSSTGPSYACSVDAATLTAASDGSYSCTFAGKIITPSGGTPAPYTTITGGTFTGLRP